ADGLFSSGGQALPVGLAKILRELHEWLVEIALLGVVDDLFVELRRNSLHDDLRLQNPLFDACTQQLNRLVGVGGKCSQACNPVFVILHGGEAKLVGKLIQSLYPAALVDGREVILELESLNRHLYLVFEEIVAELVWRAQLSAIDLLQ